MNGLKTVLTGNILPFWMEKMQDVEQGGFYGRMDGNGVLQKDATKGVVLNARILWTFSAAYRLLGNQEYKRMACRAFEYITTHCMDTVHGGVYWELDYPGNPVNTKKQTYAQAFALYGFSEYYRATKNPEALALAKDFFRLIEEKCRDNAHGGYLEAFTDDWQLIDDMRLSEKDANEKKTMNTHLHILEAYTNLYRIWPDKKVADAQRALIDIFTERIILRETAHLQLFFNEKWEVKPSVVSYGHDIEASWLLYEAACVLNDVPLQERMKTLSLAMAAAVCEGLLPDGSLAYEHDDGCTDCERHWWVQAEAVVGFWYAWKNSGNADFRQKALRVWDYIDNQLIDTDGGEWYWSRLADGSVNKKGDKAGFWKCPYHNGRMCMELIHEKNEMKG
ncbi:MAG: AGE family epimerase/isomerase [Dysgonamonadaceae bacterium]|jgi:mannobiose 2-epimerase|nr:AGE family epimerase/isomerase [Dysgonamonadaceae bacterium]